VVVRDNSSRSAAAHHASHGAGNLPKPDNTKIDFQFETREMLANAKKLTNVAHLALPRFSLLHAQR
jgi:hypothetical protein